MNAVKKLLYLIVALPPFQQAYSQQWSVTYPEHMRDINSIKIFSPDSSAMVGGNLRNDAKQTIYRSTNSGLSFGIITDELLPWLKSVDFADSLKGTTVGAEGTILLTTNAGRNWTALFAPVSRDFNKVFFINSQFGVIVGGELSDSVPGGVQTILRTINGGLTWYTVHDQPGIWIKSVYFPTSTVGYAIGDSGTILKSTNAGTNWAPVASPIQRNLNSIWFADANNGIIVGGNDSLRTILRTTNGGNSWTVDKDELGGLLTDVYFLDADTGYIVGDKATLLKTTDGGASWSPQPINGTTGTEYFNTVRFYSWDYGIIGGKNGITYIYASAPLPEAYTAGTDVSDTAQVTLKGFVNSHGYYALYSYLFSPDNFTTLHFETPYPGEIRSNAFAPADYGIPNAWLTPNTTYHYLIKAWTLGGTIYGDTISFSTGTSTAQFITMPASEIEETSATLNGTINGFSVPVNLFFEYGTTPALGSQIIATPATVSDTLLHPLTASLTPLTSLTVYYFRVKATSGSSVYYGNTLTFLSGGDLFTTLQTLPATNITDSTAVLNGLVDGFHTPAILSFDYSQGTMDFNFNVPSAFNNVGDSLSHPLTAVIHFLFPGTLYFFRVKAETPLGAFYSDTLSFYTTLPYAASVQTLAASNVTFSSAQLNGRVAHIGEQMTFSFEYGTDSLIFGNTVPGNPNIINDTSAQDISATISGLQGNSIYFYRLRGENSSGAVVFGNVRQVYTGSSYVPNWDFQEWQQETFPIVDGWNIIGDSYSRLPGQSGNYSLKLWGQNFALLGLFIDDTGSDEVVLMGGKPFHARPDSISVYMNYFFAPNDTGNMAVYLYDAANNVICVNFLPVTGSSNGSFKRLSYPLSYSSSLMPDSIIVGFLTFGMNGNIAPDPADYMIVDDIEALPDPMPEIYNGDFEDWFDYNPLNPVGWNYLKHILVTPANVNDSFSVNRVFFNPPDDYAVEMRNLYVAQGHYNRGEINNGLNNFADKSGGGFPVYQRHQTLNGYYKWLPASNDTMNMDIQMFYQGQQIATGQFSHIDSVPGFTRFEMPITYLVNNVTPDTALIAFRSSNTSAHGPSRLTIDKLSFDGYTGVEELNTPGTHSANGIKVFPNPSSFSITIQLENEMDGGLEIFNLKGSLIYTDNFKGNKAVINTVDFPRGVYMIRITQGGKRVMNKFMVVR